MPTSKNTQDETLLLPDAYSALREHFKSYEAFKAEYEGISDSSKQIRFLRLASIYKNLVKDGKFNVPPDSLSESNINYYEITYKFVALISMIEAIYATDNWLNFHDWLKSPQNIGVFPIDNPNALRKLYEQYNSEYGAINNAVKFFKALKDDEQEFLKKKVVRLSRAKKPVFENESTIKQLAQLLYERRSKFMHSAQLITDFSDYPSITTINRKSFKSNLTLSQLMRIFEIGLMRYFEIQPERAILLF